MDRDFNYILEYYSKYKLDQNMQISKSLHLEFGYLHFINYSKKGFHSMWFNTVLQLLRHIL